MLLPCLHLSYPHCVPSSSIWLIGFWTIIFVKLVIKSRLETWMLNINVNVTKIHYNIGSSLKWCDMTLFFRAKSGMKIHIRRASISLRTAPTPPRCARSTALRPLHRAASSKPHLHDLQNAHPKAEHRVAGATRGAVPSPMRRVKGVGGQGHERGVGFMMVVYSIVFMMVNGYD